MADPATTLPAPVVRRRGMRPGLLDLYLIRGVAGPFLLITLCVGVAMMLERALRLVHELAAGGADLGYFLPLLLQLVPYYLDLALPAAFMVALILLVARLDDRLELEAMLAGGWSMARIAAPLAAVGVAIGMAGLVTGGWLEPLGRHGFRSLRAEAINAGRIGRLQARAIYHPADSLALTFDRRTADGGVAGIFVWQTLPDGRELVLTGSGGRIGFVPEARAFGIDLGTGRYVAERPMATGARPYLVEFDSLAFRESLRLRDAVWQRGWDAKELTLPELAAAARRGGGAISRRDLDTEYYARIARAATIPLLPFLVLPLAFATKRGRRGLGVLLCAVLLAAFHHSMNFAKQLSLAGGADPRVAIPTVAALCAFIVALIFLSGRHLPSHSPIHSLLKPAGEGLARLLPRARRLPSVGGRTMATYLAWQLGKWTLLALAAVVMLLQMVDLFDRAEAFVARGLGPADVARYVWLRLPPMLQQAVPIAALAGAMVVFADLGRSHEMTAIRAAGVSQWRILAMTLPVPLLLSLATLFLAEQAAPRSQLAFAAWWAETQPDRGAPPSARWFRIGDEIVRAAGASPDGSRLSGIDIFRRDPRGLIVERLSAAAAIAGAGEWTLSDVERNRYGSGAIRQDRASRLGWNAPLAPPDVAAFFASASSLSSSAAQRSLEDLAPVSQGATLFATRVLRSAAEPLAPLLMLLLALPLAFVSPRTGLAWPALLYAAGGGLLYLVADGVLTVAAQVGYLPAMVGAWTAPLIALLTGITVLLYAER